jgi:hypothetical protein
MLRSMNPQQKPNKLVFAVAGAIHLVVVTLTWRDIRQRPNELMRGSKTIWRLISAANTLGSLAYWIIGRR